MTTKQQKESDLMGCLFRVFQLNKMAQMEYETFKGSVPNHKLNYCMGNAIRAIDTAQKEGVVAYQKSNGLAFWEEHLNPERLAMIKEIIHLLWLCTDEQLNMIEDKLSSAKEVQRNMPDKPLIYISGKISGMEDEARKLFSVAKDKLKTEGYEPVSPFDLRHQHDGEWSSFMRVDIKALMECDGVYFLPNWKESKGALIEHDLADKMGMKMIYAD